MNTTIRVLLIWLASFILAAVIIAMGHDVMLLFIVRTLGWDRYDTRFFHMLYYVLAGIAWLFFCILIYDFFNRMAKKGRLLYAALRTLGIELAIIAAMQTILTMYAYPPLDWISIGLIVIEGGLGGAMLYRVRRN